MYCTLWTRRGLSLDTPCILADEPTGNLDSKTTEEILSLFERLNKEGKTVLIVTHEDEVASHVQRVIRLQDGRVQSDRRNEKHPRPNDTP